MPRSSRLLFFLTWQLTLLSLLEVALRRFVRLCQQDQNLETYSVNSVRFDDTSERFLLPTSLNEGPKLLPSQQMSSWHVLVCRRAGVTGVAFPNGTDHCKYIDLLTPNVPLSSTEASAIYDGLFNHPFCGKPCSRLRETHGAVCGRAMRRPSSKLLHY